jgi:L-ascorbate metabolism protein UlaG (beta-lactamase superfamily)
VHHPLRTTRVRARTIGSMPTLEYIGHSTVLIELDGVRVLTDPLLRMRVAHLRRAVPIDESPPQPDVVLISHGHYDHLDLQSLRMLPRSAMVIAPRGLGARIQGFEPVEVEAGDELEVGSSVVIKATRAEHEGGRLPRPSGPAVGYAVLGSRRIFFAGDTDLFDEMDGLVPDLDVALIPIWGWGATLGRGKHLDPERAAEAARRLRPKLAVPIHWGTYRPLHRSALAPFLLEPAETFARAAATVAPDVEVRVLRPGERLDL